MTSTARPQSKKKKQVISGKSIMAELLGFEKKQEEKRRKWAEDKKKASRLWNTTLSKIKTWEGARVLGYLEYLWETDIPDPGPGDTYFAPGRMRKDHRQTGPVWMRIIQANRAAWDPQTPKRSECDRHSLTVELEEDVKYVGEGSWTESKGNQEVIIPKGTRFQMRFWEDSIYSGRAPHEMKSNVYAKFACDEANVKRIRDNV